MDGIINVYKPAGMSSFSCVKKVSGIVGEKKAGHGGTLDPEAIGILPVFLGKATKLTDFMHDYNKSYRAGFLLGRATDSCDIWGNTISETEINKLNNVTKEQVETALMSFVGECTQTPPMYSAIKIGGVPAYKLARAGKDVEIKSRVVNIFTVQLLSYNHETHKGVFDISCSKGTYIRSVCRDLGKKLGVDACMCSLERTEYGPFNLTNSVNLEHCSIENILPCDYFLKKYPAVEFDNDEAKKYASGAYKVIDLKNKTVSGDILPGQEYLRIYNNGVLFALAKVKYDCVKSIMELTPYKFFG